MKLNIAGQQVSTKSLTNQLEDLDPRKIEFSLFHGRRFILLDKNGAEHSFKLNDLINGIEKALKDPNISDRGNRECVKLLQDFRNIWSDVGYSEKRNGIINVDDAQFKERYNNLIKNKNLLIRLLTIIKHRFTSPAREEKIKSLLKMTQARATVTTELEDMSQTLKKAHQENAINSAKIYISMAYGNELFAKDYLLEIPAETLIDEALIPIIETISNETKEWLKDKDGYLVIIEKWEGKMQTVDGKQLWARHLGYGEVDFDIEEHVRKTREQLQNGAENWARIMQPKVKN